MNNNPLNRNKRQAQRNLTDTQASVYKTLEEENKELREYSQSLQEENMRLQDEMKEQEEDMQNLIDEQKDFIDRLRERHIELIGQINKLKGKDNPLSKLELHTAEETVFKRDLITPAYILKQFMPGTNINVDKITGYIGFDGVAKEDDE